MLKVVYFLALRSQVVLTFSLFACVFLIFLVVKLYIFKIKKFKNIFERFSSNKALLHESFSRATLCSTQYPHALLLRELSGTDQLVLRLSAYLCSLNWTINPGGQRSHLIYLVFGYLAPSGP